MATGIINSKMSVDDEATPKITQPNASVLAPPASGPAATTTAPLTQAASTPATTVAPTGIINTASATPSAPPVDHTSDIQAAYQKYLGRAGEQAGVDYYQHAFDGGENMDQINKHFMESPEYKALHPDAQAIARATPPSVADNTPSQWHISPDQTVQGQMAKLIDPNNPYYQQWATAGAQDAAARGFTGNSSIRSTGIMDSVMRNATPIAGADAATYAKAAGYNADMPNQFALKNADMANQLALARISADTAKFTAGLSADTQKSVAQLSATSQQTISQAHDANSALLASNDSAKSAYSSYVAALAQIDQNAGMDAAAKQAAIVTQTQVFNNAIAGLRSANSGTANIGSPLDINAAPASTNSAAAAAAAIAGIDVSHIMQF